MQFIMRIAIRDCQIWHAKSVILIFRKDSRIQIFSSLLEWTEIIDYFEKCEKNLEELEIFFDFFGS